MISEEANITEVVTRARTVLEREGILGEVVVADNRSEDRSAELATAAGAFEPSDAVECEWRSTNRCAGPFERAATPVTSCSRLLAM